MGEKNRMDKTLHHQALKKKEKRESGGEEKDGQDTSSSVEEGEGEEREMGEMMREKRLDKKLYQRTRRSRRRR